MGASLHHYTPEIAELLKATEPNEMIRIGGAGNKCLHVATGKLDTYVHPSSGLSFWDMCAPESLIKA